MMEEGMRPLMVDGHFDAGDEKCDIQLRRCW